MPAAALAAGAAAATTGCKVATASFVTAACGFFVCGKKTWNGWNCARAASPAAWHAASSATEAGAGHRGVSGWKYPSASHPSSSSPLNGPCTALSSSRYKYLQQAAAATATAEQKQSSPHCKPTAASAPT